MVGWRGAVRIAGTAETLLLAAAAVGLADVEAAAMTLAGIVLLALLRWRSGLIGLVGLGLLSANVAFWMAPGALSNLTHDEGLWETALPSTLTLAALATLTCAIAALATRKRETLTRAPRGVLGVAAAAAVVAVIVSAVGTGGRVVARTDDIRLATESVRFSETDLEAEPGEIGVFVSNEDLFWHTFTISELDVNLSVPVGAERRTTFDAPPGTYRFVCAIPGHTQAGMEGTLTIR